VSQAASACEYAGSNDAATEPHKNNGVSKQLSLEIVKGIFRATSGKGCPTQSQIGAPPMLCSSDELRFSLIGSHGHTFPQDIFLKRRHNLVTFVQVRPFLIISYFDTAISVGLGLRRKHRRNIRTGGSAVERCWEVFAGMVGCT
jgi:hypothetical protein